VSERIKAALITASAVFLLAALLSGPAPSAGIQAVANEQFAAAESYSTALAEYKRVWPPLYPTLLFCANRIGITPRAVNLVLFAATIALLFPVGRRVAPRVHPGWWAGLYAVAGSHAANLGAAFSEALLIPLALGVLWVTLDCAEHGRGRDYAMAGGLLAAACLTRYFALFWLVPLAFLVLARWAPGPPRVRAVRAAVTAGAAALPVLAWMLHTRLTTGFFTGMDRFASRLGEAQTTLAGNLLHTARTLFVDGFVPGRHATHEAVGRDWHLDPIGLGAAVVACVLLGACLRATRISWRTREPGSATPWLLGGLTAGYGVWLIALWTTGNNDPVYSRFVYPAYAFLGLAAAHFYSGVKSEGSTALRRPFQLLYAWMLLVQVAGTATLLARSGSA
jgi:hypothetical protein